jgi:hypothetical protein
MAEEADDAASKRQLLENPEAYVAEIDSMSLEELEEQLPYAQDLLETIETKLEEAMSSRDAALICAAAMSARLAALKQAKG